MLFNSYEFFFVFLPVSLFGYHLLGNRGYFKLAVYFLIVASLVFYGWYNPIYVLLIIGSIIFNYLIGRILQRNKSVMGQKPLLTLGVIVNILLLGYFKYANFAINSVNTAFGTEITLNQIILPLAISFFTIQQIAYLVDSYRGEITSHNFTDYTLFVIFFPKLISGPIVRFKEMLPQNLQENIPRLTLENFTVGFTIIFLGLFKKVILADSIGLYADTVFNIASEGGILTFFSTWAGALSYTFQLYFDFSGYCDIGIGLGLLFGIRLPLNFYSPYKATGVIDFWRRWHITLSRFLQDYLYIPLGGNRKGFPKQILFLLIVMAVAGLWHGDGWTFIIWGVLHGLYLVINHIYRRIKQQISVPAWESGRLMTAVSVFITFIAVTVAWVFFRADTVRAAVSVLKGMIGMNGFSLPLTYYPYLGALGPFLESLGISFHSAPGFSYVSVIMIAISLLICWFLPSVQEFMSGYRPALEEFSRELKVKGLNISWKPSATYIITLGIIAVITIFGLNQNSNFLYFQF
ncbi:MAG: MBOAT family protein [Dehalococcoidales bacterium]|nr:MBOAT family protein [Dehalococcoidales bacterium]